MDGVLPGVFRDDFGPRLVDLLLLVLVCGVVLRECEGMHAIAKKDLWLLGICATRS